MKKTKNIYMNSKGLYVKTRTRLKEGHDYKCKVCGSKFDADIRGNNVHCGIKARKTYNFIEGIKYLGL